jgi:hypothetical protein
VEKAIEALPSNAMLHDFSALTLFAQSRDKDAAAVRYAVVAPGPAWYWKTMRVMAAEMPKAQRIVAQGRHHVLPDRQSRCGNVPLLLA